MNADRLANASCVVLGAGGFIGSHLCRALVQVGARVRGFGRKAYFAHSLPTMHFTVGEFTDRIALARAVDGADVVFHLLGGAIPEASNTDPAADLEASTLASVHLFELCRRARVARIVFASSGGTVYGIPDAVPIPEEAATNPISAYGVNKLATEKFAQLSAHLGGSKAVSLRMANPFGPFQNPSRRQGLVPALTMALLSDQPFEIWGDGSIVRDYIYIDDVVQALLAAGVYDGPMQVFNIGSGQGRSVNEVVDTLASLVGRQPRPIYKPARRADVPANVLDVSRAAHHLRWSPETDWQHGLLQTIAWIQANRTSD